MRWEKHLEVRMGLALHLAYEIAVVGLPPERQLSNRLRLKNASATGSAVQKHILCLKIVSTVVRKD